MRVRGIFVVLFATTVAAACSIAGAAAANDDRDPFYSDEYDALAACAERQAQTYRYDYDRPEVSSSEQVAAFLRHTCAQEIAALAKLVAPPDRNGSPEEMTGELDVFIAQPFFAEPRKPLEERLARPHAPGAAVLERGGRRTYFRSARGLSETEVVGVLRWDAIALTRYRTFSEPGFTYYGRRDGWTYSYERTFDIWKGAITNGVVTARVYCLPHSEFVQEFRDGCDLTIPGVVSIRASAAAPQPLMLCNPGHFETGHISFRPHPPAGSPRDVARAARLSLDGGAPIQLPDGDKCLTLDNAQLARITGAKNLGSSFIGRFDTRTTTAEASGDAVAAGLVLFERLRELTFDQRAGSEMEADQTTLRERAHPFTLADALSAYDAWDASVACVAAHGADARACADALSDIVWRAASFGAKDDLEADRLAQHPADAAKRAEVLGLVRAAAEQRAQRKPAARAHFTDGEERASVMGRTGFAGSVETITDSAFSNRFQRFGYAIDGRKAWGVIPGDRFGGGSHPSLQSIVITCDGAQSPACAIRVPINDGKGAFTVHTNGAWHGAVPCIAYEGWKLAGWRLYDYAYIFDNSLGVLDANGCVVTGRPAVMRSLIHQEYGPTLVKPESDPEKSDKIRILQNVTFALALSRFLAERVTE